MRTEELRGRFIIPDVDEYLSVIADTAGPIALALRGLAASDREAVKADVEDSLRRFAAAGGYELPMRRAVRRRELRACPRRRWASSLWMALP